MIKSKAERSKKLNGAGLHQFVAAGGNPKDYKGTKGISKATVNKKK